MVKCDLYNIWDYVTPVGLYNICRYNNIYLYTSIIFVGITIYICSFRYNSIYLYIYINVQYL